MLIGSGEEKIMKLLNVVVMLDVRKKMKLLYGKIKERNYLISIINFCSVRAAWLEQENLKLRLENAHLKQENAQLRCQIYGSADLTNSSSQS